MPCRMSENSQGASAGSSPSTGATRRCLPARGGYNNHISGPLGPATSNSFGESFSHTNIKSVSKKMCPRSCTTWTPVERGVKVMTTGVEQRSSRV